MDDATVRTGLPRHLLNAVARPAIGIWLQSAEMSDPRLPRPDRPQDLEAASHHSDRVLLVGNGAAVGYGVLNHDLSLAGNLGRLLTAKTGRATYVTVVADGDMTAAGVLEALRSADLEPYDAVVATVGINEALRLSSGVRWQRQLERLVAFMLSPAVPKLQFFLVAVPPLDSITAVPRWVGAIVERHTRELNARLAAVCAGHEGVTFVPFHPGPACDVGRYRSTETYREWAQEIVDPIAARLH
jgi:hypothetical protein